MDILLKNISTEHIRIDFINYSDKFCVEQKEDEEMEEQPKRTLDMTKSYDFRDSRASNRNLIVQREEDSIPV